jgi:3-deoxy-D-arabino-heptulosonate 7-phosphate (DAHP) synthase
VSFPIGFKNGTNGSVDIALDAMVASSHPHIFLGVTESGLASIVKTAGNADVHVILRGGSGGPNYAAEHVAAAAGAIRKKRPERAASIMIDCSRMYFPCPARHTLIARQTGTRIRTTGTSPRSSRTSASSSRRARPSRARSRAS